MIGAARAVEICDGLAHQFGPRFTPPQMLRDMAARGATFYPAKAQAA
jgi:3-hydroxyacyl-CoA dehydrogenase/enoyl-CoA hydratase/3-hydroxybutyryl-CoA epimerase